MSRIFFIKRHLLFALSVGFLCWASQADSKPKPALQSSLKNLFSHSHHSPSFKQLKISCTDCHLFSIKPVEEGPQASTVPKGLLKPPVQVCHQCHLGKVNLPRPNQCLICHSDLNAIKPQDHFLDWRSRHGKQAQLDRQSCNECHTTTSCSTCHSKFDQMNPVVHSPNYRFSHSIQARVNPQSCVECHRSTGFCKDCHEGGRK